MAFIVHNIMAYYMDALPHCTVDKMADKYWNCGSPGHIHPVFGDKVIHDDLTESDRKKVCPHDLQSKLTEEKIADLCCNFNWGCYNRSCFDVRQCNSHRDPTCTRCGEALRSDAYIRLINEWTHIANELAPTRDIFDAGTAI